MADIRFNPFFVILSDEELESFGAEYTALDRHEQNGSFQAYCTKKAFQDRKVRNDRIRTGIMAFQRKRAACRSLEKTA